MADSFDMVNGRLPSLAGRQGRVSDSDRTTAGKEIAAASVVRI
jgi:hypothetical protein